MREIFIQRFDEEIRECSDFPGYWASNLGRIISAPKSFQSRQTQWIVLKSVMVGSIGRKYPAISTYINGHQQLVKIHILVARAFIPNPDNKPTVNHINGIKTDCKVGNLEWATMAEQNEHRLATGLYPLDEDWGIRFNGVGSHGSRRNPWMLRFRLPEGVKDKYFGCFPTKELARARRDFLCAFHGLNRPVIALAA